MTKYRQLFGTLESDFAAAGPISHSAMTVDAGQLSANWRRCSLSSDFWSRYCGAFVAPQALDGHLNREAATGVFAYLLNELFENCAKFSRGPRLEVRYESWVLPDRFVFQLSNHLAPEGVEPFAALIRRILEGDPEELYFQQLEANAADNVAGSGLGYLTLIKDYGVRFGFGFVDVSAQCVRVDVQAQVDRKEI